MKIYKIILSIALFFIISQNSANAQDSTKTNTFLKNWSVNLNFGSNLFYGDLRVYKLYPVGTWHNERQWAGGFMISKKVSDVFSLQGQFLGGALSGTKRFYNDKTPANLYFDGSVYEFNVNTKVDLSNLAFGVEPRFFSVYGILGIGATAFNSTLKDLQTNKALNSTGTMTCLTIPVGGGFDFRINDHIKLNFEMTLRATTTDHLDAYAYGKGLPDMYGYTSLGITYSFSGEQDVKKPLAVIEPALVKKDTLVKKSDSVKQELKVLCRINADDSTKKLYNAKLTIFNENIKGMVRIQQTLPIGFTPKIADTGKNVPVFTYANNMVVYKWDSLPKDKRFVINYNLKADDTLKGDYAIKGNAVYNGNNVYVFANTISIGNASVDTLTKKVTPAKPATDSAGIEYRVQIAAAKQFDPNATKNLAQKYNLKDGVRHNNYEGWNVYSVGSFKTLKEAVDFKEKLRNQGVKGAFVVAYKDTTRQKSINQINQKVFGNVNAMGGVLYRVQVAATHKTPENIDKLKSRLGISDLFIYEEKGLNWFFYAAGDFNNITDAIAYKVEMVNRGVDDAFVIAYYNGSRISTGQAKSINKK